MVSVLGGGSGRFAILPASPESKSSINRPSHRGKLVPPPLTSSSHCTLVSTRPQFQRPRSTPKMAESYSSPSQVVQIEKITVQNNHGEKLVGLLHETGSKELVILCHGFRSSKESSTIASLSDAISKEGTSVFRFDFAGNGESEGSFQYGNYLREADDLRSIVLYFSGGKHLITTILGHSKGGDVVLLYASRYHDIPAVVNVSGRYNLDKGIEERFGKDFMQNIKQNGFLDVKGKTGEVLYRVTEESLKERLGTDMHKACLSIKKNCRVLTVHGSSDEIISVEDAYEFDKIIPNHTLRIIEGADHRYSKHKSELAEVVLTFIKAPLLQDES